jgi:DnaJ family protein A protein 2
MINPKDRCKTCNAKKVVSERKILEVYIEKGMSHGQKITFADEGDQAPDIIPGDIVIVLDQKEHPTFKRKGDDLYMDVEIDLLTALAGGQFTIKHLDDRLLLVTIIPGEIITPGQVKAIQGEGMPGYKRPFDKGTLYVHFNVKFPSPSSIQPSQLALLEQVLPPRNPLEKPGPGMHVDEVVLSEVDHTRYNRSTSNDMEEEDDDGHHGPGVQCAQQ